MISTRATLRSLVVAVSLLSLWMVPASAQTVQRGAKAIYPVAHDVSLPLRDLARISPEVQPNTLRTLVPGPRPTPFNTVETQPDAIAQQRNLPPVGTTNLLNFAGLGGSASGGAVPPDTNGSVGSTQFVETVNLSYAVYDKTTGSKLLGPIVMNTIWTGLTGTLCNTVAGGDPVVLWDKVAQRWFISELAYNGSLSSNYLCVAVSTSSDATGSYNRYGYSLGTALPDYPKYAVWPDAYYLSFNEFTNSGSTFAGAEPCALDRTAMLSGGTAAMICFTPNPNNYSFLPTDVDGATQPPSGAPNHFVELFTGTTLEEFDFHVDFVNHNNSTFTGPHVITVTNWTQICTTTRACITQPSPGEKVDSLGDRLMHRAAYRNYGDHEAIVLSHTVKPGTGSTATAAVRWYELRATPVGGTFSVFQSGTFQNAKINLWMPSIAQDKTGDIAMGMSAASSTVKPSVVYTGRIPTDPAGKMESPSIVAKGAGVQTAGGNRWGDYSSMSVDPADDCTFWYSQEYYTATSSGNWATNINSFKFPGCH
jgi:hypothetical protein